MSYSKIRIGGVPEHFNLPIHLAHELKEFETRGIEIEWTTFQGGTGQTDGTTTTGSRGHSAGTQYFQARMFQYQLCSMCTESLQCL